MNTTSTPLVKQVTLAILLTIGFYGVALFIVASLVFIPYATAQYIYIFSIHLGLICVIPAGIILWSIFPRIDKFQPPGLLITSNEYPELFDQIKDIAAKTEQELPAEVYLVPEMSAYVAERGGLLGVGSRRVMGLGLPLLQYITVSQLRAVLAHEFGHYYNKDTKAGIWVYKIRSTIIRTVIGLGGSSWIRAPFIWYAKMFIRITNAVSRNQEFVADELAARTIGSNHLIDSLKTVHKIGPIFEVYWMTQYAPVIEAGYQPALSDGFVRFMENPKVAQTLEEIISEEMQRKDADPYDTHPSLTERIESVQKLPSDVSEADNRLASSLIGDKKISNLERDILAELLRGEKVLPLKPIEWQAIAEIVYVPNWEKSVSNYSEFFTGVTFSTLADFVKSPDKLTKRLKEATDGQIPQESIDEITVNLAASAATTVLVKQGWQLEDFYPGAEIAFHKDGLVVKPFEMLSKIKFGECLPDSWQKISEQGNLANVEIIKPSATKSRSLLEFTQLMSFRGRRSRNL